MIVIVLLPLCLFLTFINTNFFVLHSSTRQDNGDKGFYGRHYLDGFPYAVIIFNIYILLVTEILNITANIRLRYMLLFWILYFAVNIFILVKNKTWLIIQESIRRYNTKTPFIAGIIFCIFVFLLAYYTAPYNQDSMYYHLPRVLQWAQNHSVEHFAAHHTTQVSSQVMSEYIQLHNFIFSGYSDRFINLSQAVAYAIDGLLVYITAKKVGCNRSWCIVATIIFCSTNIAFAEAVTTQNDLIATMFVLSFVCIVLSDMGQDHLIERSKNGIINTFLLGCSVGLCILTKYTTGFVIVIFLMWLLIECLRKRIPGTIIIKSITTVALSALLILLPESIRLIKTFGTIFPTEISGGQLISTSNPSLILMTFAKNFLFNLQSHYFYHSREHLVQFGEWLGKLTGNDINDKSISITDFVVNDIFNYGHDSANGFLLCILLLLSIVIIIANLFRKRRLLPIGYIVCTIMSFFLLLSLMRFTPYRARYEVCYFALLSSMVCSVFSLCISSVEMREKLKGAILCIAICELISQFTYHGYIARDTGWGERPSGYFIGNMARYEDYQRVVSWIYSYDCHSIGLKYDGVYEYPLWMMTKNTGIVGRIENVNVNNMTKKYEDTTFVPDCLIYVSYDEINNDRIECHNTFYCIRESFYVEGDGWYICALPEN